MKWNQDFFKNVKGVLDTDLLIDASMISNKLGSENVTVNCEYTKKNCTKLSFISNTDKILLGWRILAWFFIY